MAKQDPNNLDKWEILMENILQKITARGLLPMLDQNLVEFNYRLFEDEPGWKGRQA